MKIHIIHTVNEILSFLFPFQELKDRQSVFLQNTWLDKVMTPTHLKDYLWHNKG